LQKYADKIINNVEESIVVVDSTYNILSVNEQTEALLNLDKKEIIGKQFNKIFNIIDSECILKGLLQNYNSPIKNQRCTLEINGDYKRVESHVEIIKNDKFIYGAIVFLRDITELEKTQKVLEESEEKFRSLYNSMISAYTLREIIYDDLGEPIDFKYLEVNPAFEKLTGIKRSNIIGKTYKEVYPKGKPYWLKVYKQAAKTGEPVDYENWMDSTNKYLKVHIFKVAKDLLGIITVDITDKKLLEDALYKEREHFKNLYSSMQNGYALCEMILDEDKLDFRYLDVNPAFLEMTNINREEVVGKRASSVFSIGVKMDYNRTFDLARQYKEAAVNGETKRFDMYSNVMQREIEVVVYGFGDGRFAVEFIDISERKRLREELIKEREKYYNLFNSMLDGFVLMDVLYDDSNKPIDFVVIDINPASEKKTGFSSDEVKDKKVSEVFLNSKYSLERSMPKLFELYDQAKEKIDTHEANGYIEAFGKYLFISAFIPKKGQFAIIMRDFTEQKSLEDEVFREKEQFKSLFENTLSGFAMNEIIFNENVEPIDFIPRLVNPAFLEITNMPEKEIIGVPASVIFDFDNMNDWPKNSLIHDYANVIKTGKPIRKEYYSTSFGKYLDVSISLARDNIVAVSFNDISEKKEAETRLQWNLSILKQAQDIAQIGSWEYYNKTEEIWLSEEAANIYGLNNSGYLEVSEVVNQVHRKDMEKYKKYFFDMNYKDTGEIDFTHRILSSEGNVRHVHLKGVVSGEVENFVISGVVQDITELITAQEDLITSEAKYRTIINNTSDAVIIYDKNLNVTYRSGNIERLFGWTKIDFEEKGSFDLLHPDDKRKVFKIFENILERGPGAREEFEVRIRNKKGELRYTKNTIVNMLDDPHINGLLINYYDITEAKEREQEIYYLSTYDELTGLYNRSYFERNESEFIKEENLPLTIIMGDLNGLKLINDMFGHSEGDKLLKVMADIIKESCGNKAIPIRFGGDEYCVILYNTDCQQAERVIENIKNRCREYKDSVDNELFYPSIALGCDTVSDNNKTLTEALRVAEDKMYKNKLFEGKSVHSAAALISSIKAAMHEKSFETEEHSARLSVYSKEIGKHIGLSDNELQELAFAAELHDIGKIGIDNSILTKPSRLNEKEWKLIKEHPEIGYRIAQASGELSNIADYILSHHERWDGRGYPMGLEKEDIPLYSRIISIADAFDVMTSDRPYREKISKEEAAKEIEKNAGTQFDPQLVKIFLEEVIDDIKL